eukprot:c20864_g1_i1 orf=599-1555(-)
MVRKVTVQGTLDFAGPEAVFDILFGSDEFMKRYHKKINSDPHAEASSWNKNHEREVKYIAISEAPKMITKLIGESFPVREAQKYIKNGDCYTIACAPRMDSPSGDRFVTLAETILSPDESGGGCAITSNVTLECKGGVWGLEGAIESFMEGRARIGFDRWLTIAKLFCQEKLAMAGAQEIDDNHECFFDAAQEVSVDSTLLADAQMPDHSTPVGRIFSRVREALSTSSDNAPGLDAFFMRTVLRDVNDIHMSCGALKGHLEKLNAKMLKVEDDLALVRLALERQNVVISKRRQLTLLGAGFAAGFGVGFMYLRLKKQA